jgi:hypothetical protein
LRSGSVFENLFIFQQTRWASDIAQFSRLRAMGDGLQVASNAVTSEGFEVEYEKRWIVVLSYRPLRARKSHLAAPVKRIHTEVV